MPDFWMPWKDILEKTVVSEFIVKLVMYQSLEKTLFLAPDMRGDKQSKCALPQGYPYASPESHAESWV